MVSTTYCPDSPAQSECAYCPDSPAQSECAYEPDSSMKMEFGDGLLARLLGKVPKTLQPKPVKYTPITAWRSYIRLTIIEEKSKLNLARSRMHHFPHSQEYKKEYYVKLNQYRQMQLRVVEVAWNERKLEERKFPLINGKMHARHLGKWLTNYPTKILIIFGLLLSLRSTKPLVA